MEVNMDTAISSFIDVVCSEMDGIFDLYLNAYTLVKYVSTLDPLRDDTNSAQMFNSTLVKVFGIGREILNKIKEAREALDVMYNLLAEEHHPYINLMTIKSKHALQVETSKEVKTLCESMLDWLDIIITIINIRLTVNTVPEDTTPSESN